MIWRTEGGVSYNTLDRLKMNKLKALKVGGVQREAEKKLVL